MALQVIFLALLAVVILFGKILDDATSRPFFEKIKTNPEAGSGEISELLQRIRKINLIRYFLRVCVFLVAAFMLFGQPRLSWIVFLALLATTSFLDTTWRRLIRDGIKKLS